MKNRVVFTVLLALFATLAAPSFAGDPTPEPQVLITNAKLLELSGPRLPYKEGPLGVVKEGAYADLIIVDGNPLENLDLVADPENNFVLIMKDGKVYKNTMK